MSESEHAPDWKVVSTQMHEWVAQIHRDHLLSEGIEAVILNKRDSSYTLNFGKGGYVFVLVHQSKEARAREILEEAKVSLEDESISIVDDSRVGSEMDSEIELESPPEETRPEDPIDLA